MGKIVAVALLLLLGFVGPAARAQFAEAQSQCHGCSPEEAMRVAQLHMVPQAIGGPVGTPTFVNAPPRTGGFIQIGKPFGAVLEQYIDAAVQAVIAALVGWLVLQLQRRTGIEIDAKHREAITHALSNQASSLIADGMVKIENDKIAVPSEAMGMAVTELMKVMPDAVKHFGLTPDWVAARIVDTIPQIAAGAAMLAKKAESKLP